MGLLLSVVSKFRKKTTTKETLEQIEEDIEHLESTLRKNRQRQKSAVLFLLSTSVFLYLLAAVVFYMWYMPTKWSQRLLYLLPFVGFPFLVFILKKTLHFVYVTGISKNAKRLEEKRKEKKKILENVMETETYKVAKELLQKFDPTRKLVEIDATIKNSPHNSPSNTPGQELRKRNLAGSQPHPQMIRPILNRPQITPSMNSTPRMINGSGMRNPAPMQLRFSSPNQLGGTPLPNAPILPRDRSFFDKVAEYFVGDGPNSRYALICSNCFSHNGMALMEEFEFTAFKCCYCGQFNPARKKRPNAPKLEQNTCDEVKSDAAGEPLNESKDIEDKNDRQNSDDDSETLTEDSQNVHQPVAKQIEETTEKENGDEENKADDESVDSETRS